MQIPTLEDIHSAAERLEGEAFRTPLLRSQLLDRLTGARVFIKPENLQRTGSFKFRGAYNAISRLTPEELGRGIAASSSGNHAQGIAAAASIFDADATIIMPHDAPTLKVERTKAHGAQVVFYDRAVEDREEAAARVVERTGMVFIHPYNHPDVIAGQGTVGHEIVQQLTEHRLMPDRVLICTGGGGLTAGVALAVSSSFPDVAVHSVEPEGFDDYRRSLQSGKIETNASQAGSVCDAILTPAPGSIGFHINREILAGGLVISDDDAREAVKFAFQELKLVVEPGGAAALAALLKNAGSWTGETIVVVVSGGNIDPHLLSEIISG